MSSQEQEQGQGQPQHQHQPRVAHGDGDNHDHPLQTVDSKERDNSGTKKLRMITPLPSPSPPEPPLLVLPPLLAPSPLLVVTTHGPWGDCKQRVTSPRESLDSIMEHLVTTHKNNVFTRMDKFRLLVPSGKKELRLIGTFWINLPGILSFGVSGNPETCPTIDTANLVY